MDLFLLQPARVVPEESIKDERRSRELRLSGDSGILELGKNWRVSILNRFLSDEMIIGDRHELDMDNL